MMYSIGAGGIQRVEVAANDKRNNLPAGTVLRLEGYSNPQYVIIKNEGINANFPQYGSRYQVISLEDGKRSIKDAYSLKFLSEKKDGRIQCYITETVLTADEIMDAIKVADLKMDEARRALAAADQAKAKERDEFLATYTYLEKKEGSSKTRWALGAANIRRELKRKFPEVTFSVKSRSYSMGCSIDVNWVGGPSTDAVEAIVDKYQYGDFCGMEDIYNYRKEQFTDIFGGAKYVMTSRREEVSQNG